MSGDLADGPSASGVRTRSAGETLTDSFWTGGSAAYEFGLREHYDSLLRDLRSRLSTCSDDSQRAECESDIARTETEYRTKLKEIGKLLF